MADINDQPEGSVAGTVLSSTTVSSTQPGHHTKRMICGRPVPEDPNDHFYLCDMCRGGLICWILQHFLHPNSDTVRLFWPVPNSSNSNSAKVKAERDFWELEDRYRYLWDLKDRPISATDLVLSRSTWDPHYWPKRLDRRPWANIGMTAKPQLRPYTEGYGRTILEEIIGLGGRRLLAVLRAAADVPDPLVKNVSYVLWDYVNVYGPAGEWLEDPARAWEWYNDIPWTPESPPAPSHHVPRYVHVSGTAASSVPPQQGQDPVSSSPPSPAVTGNVPNSAVASTQHTAGLPTAPPQGHAHPTSTPSEPPTPAYQQHDQRQQAPALQDPVQPAALQKPQPLQAQSSVPSSQQASGTPPAPASNPPQSSHVPTHSHHSQPTYSRTDPPPDHQQSSTPPVEAAHSTPTPTPSSQQQQQQQQHQPQLPQVAQPTHHPAASASQPDLTASRESLAANVSPQAQTVSDPIEVEKDECKSILQDLRTNLERDRHLRVGERYNRQAVAKAIEKLKEVQERGGR